MRIITLKAENVKRLRAVEITPEGDTVIISGRNAQGKSSVLDAIWMALAGAAGAKETTRPIRDGEEQASVELDLGELLVTRRWTSAGTNLVVAAKDGARYSKPQTILDDLIGKLSFDPLEFAEMDAKAQLRTLLDVVDLAFNPEHMDAQRKGVFDQRTEVNREVKRLEAVLSGIPVVPDDTPDAEILAAELASELGALERQHAQHAAVEAQLSRDEETLRDLRAQVERQQDVVVAGRKTLAEYPELADPEELGQEIDRIDETNAAVRAKLERARIESDLQIAREQAAALTLKLAAIDDEKAAAIADAIMPLDGLGFDEEGVLYKGVPFSQVSDSERLRVSIAIAMALNPKIRVIRITDGSLLDSESMKIITAMATESDHQIWVERVAEGPDGVAVYIEDGQIVE